MTGQGGASTTAARRLRGATLRLVGAVAVVSALLITAWPGRGLPRLAVWLVVLVALAITGSELAIRAGRSAHPDLRPMASRALFRGWLEASGLRSEPNRLDVFRTVFYDGRDSTMRTAQFVLLMTFASVISTVGVVADSTAVVIGAMLIAPLITPMMGIALGLTMGWQSKLSKAIGLVATGIAIAIGIGFVLPYAIISTVDVEINSQIVSRSSPTLVDLVVAIAAGAAGAYAIARPNVSASLPGVAIAIALVPPLSVVGVLLNVREWDLAVGAGLLFTTNLVAIIVTGGVTFLITGVAPISRINDGQHRLQVALATVAVLSIVVTVALAANGADITRDSLNRDLVRSTTLTWLEESELGLVSVDLEADSATVILLGTGDPPSAQRLADDLGRALGRPITLDLQWIPRNQTVVSSD